jgi:hypothetical protein
MHERGDPMNGRRISQRGIEELRHRLSDRDLVILNQVADLRVMSALHIEALHFTTADHQTQLAAARACRRVLERLVRDRLLVRLERRVGGVRAGSASYVYRLGHTGQRVLNLEGPRRRFREPSVLFTDHTLAITQLVVDLTTTSRGGQFELLDLQSEPRCWRHAGGGHGKVTLRPDLYAIVGTPEYEYRWFIEVDRGSEHLPTLVAKCQAYDDFYRTGTEQRAHGVFPRVCWIVPCDGRANALVERIQKTRRLTPSMFEVTTPRSSIAALSGEMPIIASRTSDTRSGGIR